MNFELMLTRAELAFQSGKFKESLKIIDKLPKTNVAEHAKVLKLKAEIFFSLGEFEHALLLYHTKGTLACLTCEALVLWF